MKNLSGMKNIEDIIRNNKDFFEDAGTFGRSL